MVLDMIDEVTCLAGTVNRDYESSEQGRVSSRISKF